MIIGPVPKPKPLGKPKPKPKPHLTKNGDEFFTDWNVDINDWDRFTIEVFGYIEGEDFAPLADQDLLLEDDRTMVVYNGCIQSIS
jgi:hypothetical protein